MGSVTCQMCPIDWFSRVSGHPRGAPHTFSSVPSATLLERVMVTQDCQKHTGAHRTGLDYPSVLGFSAPLFARGTLQLKKFCKRMDFANVFPLLVE
ncbi:hypothetical protein AVEN_88140-1 [Araneus ventricosus]|uniref:Uncharacterized protein n=1 Tax=Araneus ventricosus TaxID=182803 RepID=A0A4Y2R4B4_ARAVE|nr:hypothetical protein AVEN_88140-1 [Araneus ventricosus]